MLDVYISYVRMAELVYVYKDPRVTYLIVKRTPFSYQIPVVDKEGYSCLEILQGQGIPCPVWSDFTVSGEYIFAKVANVIYEISDIVTK